MYRYKTSGVCSSQIDFDIVDHKITHVTFHGGCNGNTQGISRLVEGMDVDDAVSRLKASGAAARNVMSRSAGKSSGTGRQTIAPIQVPCTQTKSPCQRDETSVG